MRAPFNSILFHSMKHQVYVYLISASFRETTTAMCINTIKTYACGFETRRHRKTGPDCFRDPLPKTHPKTARCVQVYSVCPRCYAELLHGRSVETCRGIEVSWEEDFFAMKPGKGVGGR